MRTALSFLPALALFPVCSDDLPASKSESKGQGAQHTATYDIRDLVERPESLIWSGPAWDGFRANRRFRDATPAERAVPVVRAMLAALDAGSGKPATADLESIQILNGTRLVIRADAAWHAQVAETLKALRRLADLRVIVQANLYEVDQAFYNRVAGAKRLSTEELEELERKFLAGVAPKDGSLWQRLGRQKPLQAGEEVKIDNRLEAAVLSRHTVVRYGPKPKQVRQRDKAGEPSLEGVSFVTGVRVSPDRRFVWLKLTETAAELKGMSKVKVWDLTGKEADIEVPVLDEATHSRGLIIPDGGSELVAVHYRPASAREKGQWWVLSLTPRIYIEEEERAIRRGLK